jgi:HSP20 family protein
MTTSIEATIERVEQLYTSVTGSRPPTPSGQRAAFPPESDPVIYVEQQLERMLASIEQTVPVAGPPPFAWQPPAAVWNDDRDLVIAIDVPGVAREDLRVDVAHGAITVRGTRKAPWGQSPRTVADCDASLGTFVRSFSLAAPVARDQIAARLEAGVLTIRIHSSTGPERS